MRVIPLTQGHTAIVDDADYDRVVGRGSWFYDRGYAARKEYVRGSGKAHPKGIKIYLHQFVLGVDPGVQVDHRNRNRLDCRRENLRMCNNAQNNANKPKWCGRGRYKGVYHNGSSWVARITVNYKPHHLGSYKSEEDAARAYDTAAKRYFGEFAYLNFPGE